MSQLVYWPPVEKKEWVTDLGKHRSYIGPVVDGIAPRPNPGRSTYNHNWQIPYKCSHCNEVKFKALKTYQNYAEMQTPMYCGKHCEWGAKGIKPGTRVPTAAAFEIDGVMYPVKRVGGRNHQPFKCSNEYCGNVFYRAKGRTASNTVNPYCSTECASGVATQASRLDITIDEYHNLHRIQYTAAQRCRGRRRGDLSLEDVVAIWKEQNGRCAITGLPMTLKFLPTTKRENPDAGKNRLFQSSMDRLDNNRGYTRDNCHLVCLGYNYMKNNMSDEEAVEFLLAVSGHFKGEGFV